MMSQKGSKARIRRSSKEVSLYLIFGILTTMVSIVLYWFFSRVLSVDYYISNSLSWAGAVSFAYITNKKIVFSDNGCVLKKGIAFFGVRLFSLLVETIFMYVMIEFIRSNDIVNKMVAQVIVIILNYVLSKYAVFRKKG